MVFMLALIINFGSLASKAKAADNHYYVDYGKSDKQLKMKIKNDKLIVSGTFYDQKIKEPWKHKCRFKNKKFVISKKVKYVRELEGKSWYTNRKNFLKNYNKYNGNGFEVKNGEVTMMYYSGFEPELS